MYLINLNRRVSLSVVLATIGGLFLSGCKSSQPGTITHQRPQIGNAATRGPATAGTSSINGRYVPGKQSLDK